MWMFVHPTYLLLSSATLSNEIFCGSFWSKILFFVRATTVKWILFLNHMNKKVVGGKHNVLVHHVDVSAPSPSGTVVCNPFKKDILCSFMNQNHVFCVPATKEKWILFLNHRNRKVVGGKHNVVVYYVDIYAPDLAGLVLCNPFKWDILWFILIKNHTFCACNNSEMNFIQQAQKQKSGRRQTQCSSTLFGC